MLGKTKSDHAFHTLRLIIMIVFTVYAMMQRLTPLGFLCDSYVFPAGMLALCAVYLIWDLLTKRCLFQARYTGILIAFLAVTALSSLVNIRNGLYTNVMIMIYLVVDFFIFYQFGNGRDIREVNREFRIIGYLISIISLLYVLISISTYLLCMEYQYVLEETGRIIEQGYQSQYRRVWGFYYEANFQGLMAIIVLYFSVLNILHGKNRFEKSFNIFNILMHLVMLVLTGSRSSMVAFYASAFVAAFYFFGLPTNKRRFRKVKSISVRIVGAGLACVLAFGVVSLVKQTLPYLQQFTLEHIRQEVRLDYADLITRLYAYNGKEVEFKNLDVNYNKSENGEVFERQEIIRLDIEAKDDRSNGRVHVWRDSFKLFLMRPLLGVSPSMQNRAAFAKVHFPDACNEIVTGVSLLNGYLEVLVGGGLVSVLVIGAFLLLCIKKLWTYQQKSHTHRTELGLLTAILAGMLSFILFTTDLFYSRTVYTYFFWICLGYGMYLIEYDEKHDAPTGYFAVVCDTPVQIMNAVRFVEGDVRGSRHKSDLFVYHQFGNSHEIAERLRASGIFRHVYDVEKYPSCSKITTLFRMLFAKRAIARACGQKIPFAENDYGTLALCAKTPFTLHMHIVLDAAHTVMLEEGTGSYFANVNHDTTKLFRFIDEVVCGGRLQFHPSAMYVSDPALYKGTMARASESLPPVSRGCLEALKRIFDYKAHDDYQKKTVYLFQPLHEIDGTLKTSENTLLETVKRVVGTDMVIKPHPRMPNADIGSLPAAPDNLWELECLQGKITDEHILIACFSTAQIVPKILTGHEPTLIFTYKLLFTEDTFQSERWRGILSFIENLKRIYRSPEKICVPETQEELAAFLTEQSK